MNKSTRMFVVGVAVGFAACYLYNNMDGAAGIRKSTP